MTTLSFYWNFPVVIYLYGEVVLVAAYNSPDIVSVQNPVLPASAVVNRPQRGDLTVSRRKNIQYVYIAKLWPGPSCSKLTTWLVNVLLKISNVNIFNLPIFFVEKM